MKKFLCYDTNDAASGKISVSTNGVLSPNATVPSTNGTPYQQLVTDGDSNTKWEDRLAYDNKTVLVEQTKITNAGRESIIDLSLLANGSFVTVNIDGTEYNATLEEGGEYMLGTGVSNCYYHIGHSGGINFSSKTTFTSGYPFFVVIDADGKCMVLFDGESTGTEHTFGVYAGEIKQIDPKFIPSKETFFVLSGPGFRTGTDWDAGEDVTIADIVTAYHDGGARIFQMSSGECIGISNVIGASASGSSSPFITYYNYTSKTVFTKS